MKQIKSVSTPFIIVVILIVIGVVAYLLGVAVQNQKVETLNEYNALCEITDCK